MQLLEKLDMLLKEKNLSKRAFAEKSGIPYNTVMGLYNRGMENIQLSTLKKIANYFDVSLDYLGYEDVKINSWKSREKGLL